MFSHTIHPVKTAGVQSRVSPACCSPQLIGSVPGSGFRDSVLGPVISGLRSQVQRTPTSGSFRHYTTATWQHAATLAWYCGHGAGAQLCKI